MGESVPEARRVDQRRKLNSACVTPGCNALWPSHFGGPQSAGEVLVEDTRYERLTLHASAPKTIRDRKVPGLLACWVSSRGSRLGGVVVFLSGSAPQHRSGAPH
jgi:hypothetical protein